MEDHLVLFIFNFCLNGYVGHVNDCHIVGPAITTTPGLSYNTPKLVLGDSI